MADVETNIDYNKIYDYLYQHGVTIPEMRISNLHHETAIQSLLLVQEIEPDTWNKVVIRIDGASSIKHLKKFSFTVPVELPYMFLDWEEYAMYLAENIIQEEKNKKALFNKISTTGDLKYSKDFYNNFSPALKKDFWRAIINTILSSDWDFTKLENFALKADVMVCRRLHRGEFNKILFKDANNKYLENNHKLMISGKS